MRKTRFAGLTALEPGESIFVDGSSFTARNPDITDHYLEAGARTHHHDGAPPLANPTTEPQVTVFPTGGALPSDTTILVAYTRLDGEGGETEASPITAAVTPPGITAPLNPPVTEIDYGAGTLTVGTYHYAVTLVDLSGGETTASPIASVVREPGNPNATITISDLAALVDDNPGAVRYRLYRAKDLGKLLLFSEGVQDVIEDDGSLECDCCTEPPATNQSTTGQTGALSVVVTAGMLGDAAGWRLYVTADGSFSSPSLYGTDRTLAEADQTITITSLDVDDGAPPDISTSIGGAPKINPDTDLLNWHWKQPVGTASALPEDSNTENGDVRMALDDGTIYRRVAGAWAPLTAPAAHWMPPVASFSALPTNGNTDGDVRLTLDTYALYAWSAGDATWHDAATGSASGDTLEGHVVYDEAAGLTQRAGLAFVGDGVTVTDDNNNDLTIVTIPGGGGGGGPTDPGVTFPLALAEQVSWKDANGNVRIYLTVQDRLYWYELFNFDFAEQPDVDPFLNWAIDGASGLAGTARISGGKLIPTPSDIAAPFFLSYGFGGSWRDATMECFLVIDSANWRSLGMGLIAPAGNTTGLRAYFTSTDVKVEYQTDQNATNWSYLDGTSVLSTPSVGDEIGMRFTRNGAGIDYSFWNITTGEDIGFGSAVVPAPLANFNGRAAFFGQQAAADSFHLNRMSAERIVSENELVANVDGNETVLTSTLGADRWNTSKIQPVMAPDWQLTGFETRLDQASREISFHGSAYKATGAPPVAGELIATFTSAVLSIRDGDVAVVTGDVDGRELGIASFTTAPEGYELRWVNGRSTDPATKAPWLSLEGVRR